MTTIWALVLPLMGGAGIPASTPNRDDAPVVKGTLFVDGGGKGSVPARKRVLDLAGGPKARLLIVPQASNLSDMGPRSAARWREAGAENVSILDLADPKVAIDAVRAADFVWITGGDQGRLMRRLEGTGIPEAIRERFRAGAAVGGTSAGAAVMSDVMIARSVEDFPRPLCNYPLMGTGLGLWPGVIVDQHFTKLRRAERLKRALADTPGLVGIGVDESTIAIVRGRSIEVAGDGHVFVFDPRKEPPKPTAVAVKEGGGDGPMVAPPAPEPVEWRVTSLNPGVTFDLDRGMIADPIAETH